MFGKLCKAIKKKKKDGLLEKPPQDVFDHLKLREGLRKTVYLDSEGHPTVGVGHLVRPEDNLRVGERVSGDTIDEFLKQDAFKAYKAALNQARKAGISSQEFVNALTSVNFQLGTHWIREWPNTWKMLKKGNYQGVINSINNSLWAKQTPVRVKDFKVSLEKLISRA